MSLEVSSLVRRLTDGKLIVSRQAKPNSAVFAHIIRDGKSWLVQPIGGWKNRLIDGKWFGSEAKALEVTLKILEDVARRAYEKHVAEHGC